MEHVVLARHNSYLFKGTVEENLRMAKPDATEDEMNAVLQKVNLLGFLQTQDGLQTKLLEKAGNLSGGQCQRLVIARALLKDAEVYIFDEATSNIDIESEELIMQVIHELAKTRTVLFDFTSTGKCGEIGSDLFSERWRDQGSVERMRS